VSVWLDSLECADLSALWSARAVSAVDLKALSMKWREAAADQSGAGPPHSKELTSER